jgi:hypothetical protein
MMDRSGWLKHASAILVPQISHRSEPAAECSQDGQWEELHLQRTRARFKIPACFSHGCQSVKNLHPTRNKLVFVCLMTTEPVALTTHTASVQTEQSQAAQ